MPIQYLFLAGAYILRDMEEREQREKEKVGQLNQLIEQQPGLTGISQRFAGLNLNKADEDGILPLLRASKVGNLELVKQLIAQGANVNQVNDRGNSALQVAALHNNLDVVKYLLSKGAIADKKNVDSVTPLTTALMNIPNADNIELIKELVKHGAKLQNISDEYMQAILNNRVCYSRTQTFLYLLEQQVDFGKYCIAPPAWMAIDAGNFELFKIFFEKKFIYKSITDPQVLSSKFIFDKAFISKNPQVIWYLLNDTLEEFDLNSLIYETSSQDPEYPVNYVIMMARDSESSPEWERILKLMIDRGANVNLPRKDGTLPIHIAARGKNKTIFDLVIRHTSDANLTVVNPKGATPLALAAIEDNGDFINEFIKRKVDVNQKFREGFTALHMSAFVCSLNAIKILISAGALIDAQTDKGITPLVQVIASKNKDKKVSAFLLLLEANANPNIEDREGLTSIHDAAMSTDHIDVLKILIERNVDINSKTQKKGSSPLHIAVQNNNEPGVVLLLKNGAKVDIINNNNKTPLHIAAYNGLNQIIRLLHEYKADLNHCVTIKDQTKIKDQTTMTPLKVAIFQKQLGAIKTLVELGATVNTPGEYSPLHTAAGSGTPDIIKFLLANQADRTAKSNGQANGLKFRGITPFLVSVALKNNNWQELLLSGGDMNQCDDDGNNALHIALLVDCSLDYIKELLKNNRLNLGHTNQNHITPFQMACLLGKLDIIPYLIQVGCQQLPCDTVPDIYKTAEFSNKRQANLKSSAIQIVKNKVLAYQKFVEEEKQKNSSYSQNSNRTAQCGQIIKAMGECAEDTSAGVTQVVQRAKEIRDIIQRAGTFGLYGKQGSKLFTGLEESIRQIDEALHIAKRICPNLEENTSSARASAAIR